MEHITIISKEAITVVPTWVAFVGASVSILLVLSTFIYWKFVKDPFKAAKYLGIVGSIAIILAIAWAGISAMFFKQPTGEYRYEATINKETITVSEYEEFMDKYNVTVHDGIYSWTGEDIE